MSKYYMKGNQEFTDEEKIKIFDKIHKFTSEYIDYVNSSDFHCDNDYEYYFYETVIEQIAGKEFWGFYNKKVT